ncbi:hypothetical protein HYPSUDRAFT_45654 [Hypholoma sublateritium FD-334 SS-4]|uniref:Aip3p/Bud6 N-terminal domain-containing protein n=1 Tax=Hypholoma sublateritium (strain FD-334 SS-4) TaxID=945553 RepID=A0A0D2NMV3_HYPSF|nr:hypothetical protein HYPSUDRAFT_45654 [Hypholoma sublateritium FD-334 SS-4]
MSNYYQRSSYSSNSDNVAEQVGQPLMQIQPPADIGNVPRAVHSLLSSTKRLQEVLRLWSTEKATESDVSDLYVQIGHEFNATITAFSQHRIDLTDILEIPNELRTVLEQCLSEDPSPEVLTAFMPDLRKVIFKLLRGLQSRQEQWQAVTRRFDGSRSSLDLP